MSKSNVFINGWEKNNTQWHVLFQKRRIQPAAKRPRTEEEEDEAAGEAVEMEVVEEEQQQGAIDQDVEDQQVEAPVHEEQDQIGE